MAPIQSSFHRICPTLEYLYTHPHHEVLDYHFSLVALIALVPARVAADDADSNDDSPASGRGDGHPHCPPPPPPPPPPTPTQVLWGQCTFTIPTICYRH